jgi:hypothetical protein
MSYYAVTLALTGPLAAAVAVEWTNLPAPVASGQGWEPCLRQPDGTWRLASHDPRAGLHRRGPGRFADLAIRYRLEPAGAWSAGSLDRKEIVLLAVEGEEERPDLLTLPGIALAPSLAGAGVIGTELALDPGIWTGFPAPTLAFQWRRDGAPIPGASARAYAPAPADDGCALDCLVSAASLAGRAEAATPAVVVRYAAPTRRAELAEEVFDEAEGVELVETAPAFAGENLSFSAEGFAIDARTGVLSLPVDAPVSGGIVTIAARNSGGAATAELRYTVEGAPGRMLGAGDVTVLRSLWRPAGQSVTFSPEIAFPGLANETVQAIEFTNDPAGAASPVWHPVRAKAGAAGVWQLFDRNDPVGAGQADAALWGPATPRTGRLRFRWRVSQLHPWSEAGSTLAVPAPEGNLTTLFSPAPAMVAEAISGGMQEYRVMTPVGNGEGNPSTRVYSKWDTFLPVLYLRSGQTGRFAVSGNTSKDCLERVVDQLLLWASDAGDKAPPCRSGYHGQHEMRFVATVALARITPVVWDHPRLNDAPKWKTRLDLLMKGCLVANAVIASDAPRPFGEGFNRERTIRGYTAGRNNVPNFSSPPRLTPHVVAAYMERNGEDPVTWMNGFDRARFSAQMEAVGGILEARATFRQDWTPAFQTARYGFPSPLGRGYTADEIRRALTNDGDGPWRCFGYTLSMTRQTFQRELERTFSQTVVPGPQGVQKPTGTNVGETGPGWTTRHGVKYGANTENQLRACLGAPITVNGTVVTDKSAWADLPNPGATGMHIELDTIDGGEAGGPAVRSAMSYAISGLGATMIAFVTMILYGKFNPEDPTWAEARARFQVGVRDLDYRARHGHRSYAKGGFDSSNNEDFGPEWIAAQSVKWSSFIHMMDMIAAWWNLPSFPTND